MLVVDEHRTSWRGVYFVSAAKEMITKYTKTRRSFPEHAL
jgi:hypothetical protein